MNKRIDRIIFLCIIIAIMLFILFLTFFPPKVHAGEIHGNVELGKDIETPNAFVELNVSYDHKLWVFNNSLFGGIECWFHMNGFHNYPFLDIYKFGYRVSYREFDFTIRRFCPHAVYSGAMFEDHFEEYKKFLGYMTTVSIGIRWRECGSMHKVQKYRLIVAKQK